MAAISTREMDQILVNTTFSRIDIRNFLRRKSGSITGLSSVHITHIWISDKIHVLGLSRPGQGRPNEPIGGIAVRNWFRKWFSKELADQLMREMLASVPGTLLPRNQFTGGWNY